MFYLFVGFENSAMKSSFSLSSLQGASGSGSIGSNGSPLRHPAPPERPYHSLTKKRYVFISVSFLI